MTIHRASCTDCPWTFEDEDLIEVSDELERHSQKEQHHVDMQRAVATDGGRDANETVELRIRTDRQNLAGIISVYGIGIQNAPAFGPAASFLEDVLQGMEDVYPQENRISDMLDWVDDGASGVSRDLDVDLVELEDDPTDAVDGDGPDTDRESVDIPITDGGQQIAGAEAGSLDLTAFQQNILVILSEKARYGLAIKRELEDYYGKEVNHGRLYPNLDTLVEYGLVEKSELDKRTNQYALTGAGEHVVEDQLRWIFSKYASDEGGFERVHDLVDEGTEDSR